MRRDRTAIGNLDSPLQATIDRTGRLSPPHRRWSLAWWVRAADRWHVPDAEAGTAVEQRLVDDAPVVETSVRVPGGHVLHRAWAVVHGEHEWIVVEVEDRSRQPVAVAFVVDGARRIDYRDGVVLADRAPAIQLPRSPSRFTTTPEDGGAEQWAGATKPPIGFVFPIAHTARVRVAVPLTDGAPAVDANRFPDADRVASGWRAHAQPPGSMRFDVPGDLALADRAELLIVHDDPDLPLRDLAAALATLDRFGHHDTVRRMIPTLVDELRRQRWVGAGRALVTLARHHQLAGTTLADDHVGPVADAAHRLRRRAPSDPWTPAGQLAAAELLDGAGQPDAAARCRELAAGARDRDLPVDHTLAAAARLDELHAALLAETVDGLALLPAFPDGWLGQGIEVHDTPTRFGRASFAVRWHGARPALLWEVEHAARLTAPRLDPSWSSSEARGEALLHPVEPAGGLPKVVAPLGGHGTAAESARESGTFE